MEATILKDGPYRIQIRKNGKDLFYTSSDIKLTDKHIFFIDRDNKNFVYKLTDLEGINPVRRDKQ